MEQNKKQAQFNKKNESYSIHDFIQSYAKPKHLTALKEHF
jgi:hypothetical protein